MKNKIIYSIFLFLLFSCENNKQGTESSEEIEFIDQNFDIEKWADQKVTKKDELKLKTNKIKVGGNDIFIPSPKGFVNASKTTLGEVYFDLVESPIFREYLFLIKEDDYNELNSDDFYERWETDFFVCGVRTLRKFENKDFSRNELALIAKELQEQNNKILDAMIDAQNRQVERIKDNMEDSGFGSDYKVLDTKVLSPFDIQDDSFSMLKLSKTQDDGEVINEIHLMNYLNLNQRLVVFYISVTDAGKLEFMKKTMKSWVEITLQAN